MKKSPVMVDRFAYERICWNAGGEGYRVAGVDEAGRGPLAGPVIAAAVILPRRWDGDRFPEALRGLNDSKQLSEKMRETFFAFLTTCAEVSFGIGTATAPEIDEINILQATHRAMNSALAQLHPGPDHVLVDGRAVKSMRFPQTALVKGDARSYSIAAASVLAKVTRDRLMLQYEREFPGYGFAEHKGYGTAQHLTAIAALGPCPLHRRSFAPLKSSPPDLFARSAERATRHGILGTP